MVGPAGNVSAIRLSIDEFARDNADPLSTKALILCFLSKMTFR